MGNRRAPIHAHWPSTPWRYGNTRVSFRGRRLDAPTYGEVIPDNERSYCVTRLLNKVVAVKFGSDENGASGWATSESRLNSWTPSWYNKIRRSHSRKREIIVTRLPTRCGCGDVRVRGVGSLLQVSTIIFVLCFRFNLMTKLKEYNVEVETQERLWFREKY